VYGADGEACAQSAARRNLLNSLVKNPSALRYATEAVRGNRELVLEASAQNASIVEFASDSLRRDKSFAVEAVSRNGDVLWHLPKKMQQESSVLVAAIAKSQSFSLSQEVEPAMGYYVEILSASRRAVSEIRREERAARQEQAIVAEKHQQILEREVDALEQRVDELERRNADLEDRLAVYEAAAAVTDSSSDDDDLPPHKKHKPQDDPFTTSWEKDLLDAIDSERDPAYLATNAIHLQCLTTSHLQAKLDDLAALALQAGADKDQVDKIKSRALAVEASA